MGRRGFVLRRRRALKAVGGYKSKHHLHKAMGKSISNIGSMTGVADDQATALEEVDSALARKMWGIQTDLDNVLREWEQIRSSLKRLGLR